jgi:peptidoglycan/xylan/chitin deacetylase (PgdA/CDA1 family)
VLLGLIAARALADEPAGGPPPTPDVGSRTVLETLWTPDQLRAAPGDAKRKRLRPPDRFPPAQLAGQLATGNLPAESVPPAGQAAADPSMPAGKSIRRVRLHGDAKLVALTFDLCERADQLTAYDAAIIDYLRREGIAATFFAGGKWMRSHPERAMQLIADPLFEVGNHAWTHGNLRVLTGEKAEQQIAWAQQEYAELRQTLADRAAKAGVPAGEIARIPNVPAAFRFPYGVCSPPSLQLAGRLGLAAIQWDVVSGDASPAATAAQVARTVLKGVRPGSIVVMHANGNGHGTAAALPTIVEGLGGKGYRFVTVGELLRSGEADGADDCYELRPGDNRRYDKLFGEGTG